jgi:DNA-binding transcriptional ArsR family regulator
MKAPSVTRTDVDIMIGHAQQAGALLKALAHEARLVILCLLLEKERSVTEIEEILGLRQPAISQQLARLRADGVVDTRRDGKNVYYSLARSEAREVIGALHRAFCDISIPSPGVVRKTEIGRQPKRPAARAKSVPRKVSARRTGRTR